MKFIALSTQNLDNNCYKSNDIKNKKMGRKKIEKKDLKSLK